MKKFTKIALIVASFVLVAALSVGGTLAWLQAETAEVKNTFSPTNIKIDLWEHEYVPSDDHTADENDQLGTLKTTEDDLIKAEEDYKMVPGVTLPKDPFLRVEKGSEPCYIFVEVCPSKNAAEYLTWEIDNTVWTEMTGVVGDHLGKIYYKADVVAYNAENPQDFNILKGKQVNVRDTLTSAQMAAAENVKPILSFYGYAVQSTGFASAENAWAETYGA